MDVDTRADALIAVIPMKAYVGSVLPGGSMHMSWMVICAGNMILVNTALFRKGFQSRAYPWRDLDLVSIHSPTPAGLLVLEAAGRGTGKTTTKEALRERRQLRYPHLLGLVASDQFSPEFPPLWSSDELFGPVVMEVYRQFDPEWRGEFPSIARAHRD